MKEKEAGGKIKGDSQGEFKELSKERTQPEDHKGEDHKKREIPLEKMTKAELLEKIRGVQESAENNFDLYARSQAEMDNMKKRFQKEKEELVKFSKESLIRQLLPVADNLEKAITHSEDENSLHALKQGVELTLKGLMDTLEKAGLEEVKAVGEPFDPNFHEAVSEQEDNAVKPGTVLQELQKGYFLNQRLIRPSLVIVSKSSNQ